MQPSKQVGGRPYANRCHRCRRRKIKCDGERPSCNRCTSLRVACPGYDNPLEFKHSRDVSSTASSSQQNEMSMSQPTPPISNASPQVYNDPTAMTPGRTSPPTAQMTQQSLVQPDSSGSGNTVSTPQAEGAMLPNIGYFAQLKEICVPDDDLRATFFDPSCIDWIPNKALTWIDCATVLIYRNNCDRLRPLYHALLALSMLMTGMHQKDKSLVIQAMTVYQLALSHLNAYVEATIENPSDLEMEMLVFTCYACAWFEMLNHNNMSNAIKHIQGAAEFLHKFGPEKIKSQLLRGVYYEMRSFAMFYCFYSKQALFFCRESWTRLSWRHEYSPASLPLNTLLDEARRVPLLLEAFQNIRARQPYPQTISLVDQRDVMQIATGLLETKAAILNWASGLRGENNHILLYSLRRSSWSTGMLDPIEASQGSIFPMAYRYVDFGTGMSMLHYMATLLTILQALTDVQTYLSQAPATQPRVVPVHFLANGFDKEAVTMAEAVCQSLEYFFETEPRLLGKVATVYCFQAARHAFERAHFSARFERDLTRELLWCQMADQIMADANLPGLGYTMR